MVVLDPTVVMGTRWVIRLLKSKNLIRDAQLHPISEEVTVHLPGPGRLSVEMSLNEFYVYALEALGPVPTPRIPAD